MKNCSLLRKKRPQEESKGGRENLVRKDQIIYIHDFMRRPENLKGHHRRLCQRESM